ncbi:cupin domain-containing protein [Microbispora sp. RL4-1S]|uniref:Cupin domain-containing protein n=1 Tax=Microbispora oryzae TaxID=2806554 RepID=A0A940WSI3_9ACTN|nr:cupin domain-containing protein [Microbispora oryzae]MBP2706236.1 cupin domain-containing protein [Microbispora oryzae]
MIDMRITGGVLIAATTAAILGCAPATEHASTTTTPAAAAVASTPPSETLTPLIQQELPNVKGRTFTSATVTLPPGARAMPHRHGQAFVYAYVLEGTVRSQLEGAPKRTYHQGENWVEQPGAHHVATENASDTEPAKLLVVFVSTTGEPLKTDDTHQ